jgi:hypothetical protein
VQQGTQEGIPLEGEDMAAEPLYLLGHLEADIGTQLKHLTHFLRGGRDQGNLLYGG